MQNEDPPPTRSARGAEGPGTVEAGGSPWGDGKGTVTEHGRAQEDKLCDGEWEAQAPAEVRRF